MAPVLSVEGGQKTNKHENIALGASIFRFLFCQAQVSYFFQSKISEALCTPFNQ